MSAVLSQDPALRDALVDQVGFTVKEVRVSPDHAKAFILWDSYNGQVAGAERALRKCHSRLRSLIAKAMAARSVPTLQFRRDGKTAEENELMRIFDQIEEERKGGEG